MNFYWNYCEKEKGFVHSLNASIFEKSKIRVFPGSSDFRAFTIQVTEYDLRIVSRALAFRLNKRAKVKGRIEKGLCIRGIG